MTTVLPRGSGVRSRRQPFTRSASLPPGLAELADRSGGVLSRAQLRTVGLSAHGVAVHIRARRWRIIGRQAVVLHRGPLSVEQRWRVAVVHAGPRALLGGRSGLASHGLRDWEDGLVYVLVPKGTRVPPLSWLRVQHTRRWPATAVGGVPRCDVARAAIDAAIRSRNPRTAIGVLAATVQQRLALPEWLFAELESAGRVRHRRLLLSSLGDLAGGSHSVTEVDFLRLCRRNGVPDPVRQVRRRDSQGRIRYLDATWVLPDGRTVVVEIDGGLHLRADQYWDDMARDNDNVLRGDISLRFPGWALRTGEARVAAQLRTALAPLLAA